MYKHSDLDKKICDLEEGATNTETLREFIRNSENNFCIAKEDLNSLSEEKLNEYIEWLDYLWEK